MQKFDKQIVVSKTEWNERLDTYLERELGFLRAESLTDESFEKFFKTGDLAKFIEDCLTEGSNPARGWEFVFACNPNRDYELLISNLKHFWDWLLDDPDTYLPEGSVREEEGKDRKTSLFNLYIRSLGTVNSPVLDPECAAKLFLWVYGEEFEPRRSFPISLGKSEWNPQIEVDPVVMFTNLMALIDRYLFDGSSIEYKQSLALIDYWFSIIPHLEDHRIFDTVAHKDSDKDYPRRQQIVYAFFAHLSGYDVDEEYDTLPHLDPGLEQYIKDRFSEIEMPESYYRMLEFIDKHKEDSLFALEEE
jgi:hypothetical protein